MHNFREPLSKGTVIEMKFHYTSRIVRLSILLCDSPPSVPSVKFAKEDVPSNVSCQDYQHNLMVTLVWMLSSCMCSLCLASLLYIWGGVGLSIKQWWPAVHWLSLTLHRSHRLGLISLACFIPYLKDFSHLKITRLLFQQHWSGSWVICRHWLYMSFEHLRFHMLSN